MYRIDCAASPLARLHRFPYSLVEVEAEDREAGPLLAGAAFVLGSFFCFVIGDVFATFAVSGLVAAAEVSVFGGVGAAVVSSLLAAMDRRLRPLAAGTAEVFCAFTDGRALAAAGAGDAFSIGAAVEDFLPSPSFLATARRASE